MNSPGRQVPNMLLEISGEITPERMKRWSQSKNNTQLWMGLVIEARSDAVRAILHRNLECQVMNQGKLEVVKQEMARVNVDILGISELRWTGMGEFNSDDHYIYYKNPLEEMGVAIIVNNRVQNAVLGCSLKNNRMISVHFQGKPFNITVIQAYAPTSNAEEAETGSMKIYKIFQN